MDRKIIKQFLLLHICTTTLSENDLFIVQKAKNVRVKYILHQHQKNISTADNMTFIIYKHL